MENRPAAKAALFLALSAVAVVGYLFLLSLFRGTLGAFSAAVPAALLALASLILNFWFFHHEGRSLADLGFDAPRLRIVQAAIAFTAGGLLVGVWALAVRGVTSASWHMVPAFNRTSALGAIVFAIFNNAGEELLYRGYLFLLLARSYGRGVAVIFTCSLFTLLHIQGGVPWPSAVAGVLTASLLFAALFVRWQSLPLVLALHVATNVFQELAGLRISGLTLFAPVFRGKASASQSNTILAAMALINTALALLLFVSARSRREIAALGKARSA